MQKSHWLNKKINISECRKIKKLLRGLKIHTVCQEAFCPNISECFNCGVATFLILGDVCTRRCAFCGVKKGQPAPVDKEEPERIKEAVRKMALDYVVITSPTRDDIKDGGAAYFCETTKQILSLNDSMKVELLIPDFSGNLYSLEKVSSCGAAVIAHNLETVPSLYAQVRKGADYKRSLDVLSTVKSLKNNILTKSGIMLGLGETEAEVLGVLSDLRATGCDFLTLGQYLPPSLKKHFPLKEYIHPEKFDYFKNKALKIGFKSVKSSPYTRSSYMAHAW